LPLIAFAGIAAIIGDTIPTKLPSIASLTLRIPLLSTTSDQGPASNLVDWGITR
jgi:hypothetical protein